MKYHIAPSIIHGNGVFASADINKNEPIGVGIDFYLSLIPYVTDYFGSWINHSYQPNTYLKYRNGKWLVVASKNIKKGSEVLLDYNKTPWYIRGPESHYI